MAWGVGYVRVPTILKEWEGRDMSRGDRGSGWGTLQKDVGSTLKGYSPSCYNAAAL